MGVRRHWTATRVGGASYWIIVAPWSANHFPALPAGFMVGPANKGSQGVTEELNEEGKNSFFSILPALEDCLVKCKTFS